MRVILGIETSTDLCSVAVSVDGTATCWITLDRPRRHAERLVPMLAQALRAAGIGPGDLDAVAVSAGPGSYTGLRIGVSAAKGVSVATGARLVPVPSLRSLALSVGAATGSMILAAYAARRSEVYAAAFRIDGDGLPQLEHGPMAGSPAEALHGLPATAGPPVVFAGSGARLLSATARSSGLPHAVDPVARPSATAVVTLARVTAPVDVEPFEPYYLREFTARPASGSVFDRLPF